MPLIPSEKHNIFASLMNLRIKLAWAAQRSDEDFYDLCCRMEKMLHDYNNLRKIAEVEFTELCDSALARERMAIETFLCGLRPEVRRYICKPHIYISLHQAMGHAMRIHSSLEDLRKIKHRYSIHL